jgi:hypothetical protein
MSLGDVGFVKVDVEGHELDVLAGLSDLLVACLPNLIIEIGDARRGGSLSEVRGCLEPLGYLGFRLDERGLLTVLPKEMEIKGSVNVIFLPMHDDVGDRSIRHELSDRVLPANEAECRATR